MEVNRSADADRAAVYHRVRLGEALSLATLARPRGALTIRQAKSVSPGRYRDGGELEARLPLLSTWCWHADTRHTCWHVSGAPQLLALVAERLEPGAAAKVTALALTMQACLTDRLTR